MNALERNNTWEIFDRSKEKILLIASDNSLLPRDFHLSRKDEHYQNFSSIGFPLQLYDVKNTFLHGDLNEKIYMNILHEFEGDRCSKVCKLQKAITWFGRFTKAMKEFEYKKSQELLAKIRKLGCKPITTPVDPNNMLGESQKEPTVDK
ncbi:hypothetical protein CR513_47475, partial [Mucuna pruriens]